MMQIDVNACYVGLDYSGKKKVTCSMTVQIWQSNCIEDKLRARVRIVGETLRIPPQAPVLTGAC